MGGRSGEDLSPSLPQSGVTHTFFFFFNLQVHVSLRKCAQCLGVWDLGFLDSNRGRISTFVPCPGFPISARQEGHTWEDRLGGAFALGECGRAPRKSLRSDSCSFIVQQA